MKIKLLDNLASIPERGTEDSAGYDLKSTERIILKAHDTAMVPTGIAIEIPNGQFGMICSRSGLAAKNGVFVLNAPGIIDSDYRGEIKCIMHNSSATDFIIEINTKIAQLIITSFEPIHWELSISLSQTKRDNNGFGSTG